MIKTVKQTTPTEHILSMGIKMPLPPFAVRDGEQSVPVKIERENGKITSSFEAEFLVSVSVIKERDIKLLEMVNKFVVISTNQLHNALKLDGIEITRNQLNNYIKKLIKYRFLQAVRFENGINKSGYILALENNGALFLKSRHKDGDVHVRFVGYFKTIEPYKLKKNLSANQLIIDLFLKNGESIDDFRKGQVIRDLQDMDRTKVIRSECYFKYNQSDYLVEVVRRNPDWSKKLLTKLRYYNELLILPERRLNINITNPILILIAEDEYHCEEVLKLVSKAKYKNIVVTCDKFTYALTPENAFFKPVNASETRLLSRIKALLMAS